MKLKKALLACTLALAALTCAHAQSAEGHPDWPGAGELFVGTCYQPVDRSLEQVKRDSPDMPIGVLAHAEGEVAGCLFRADDQRPSERGPLLYFNVDGRLEEAVAAAVEQGGRVLKPPHAIGAFGHRAIVLDSEGNRIALHSQ